MGRRGGVANALSFGPKIGPSVGGFVTSLEICMFYGCKLVSSLIELISRHCFVLLRCSKYTGSNPDTLN